MKEIMRDYTKQVRGWAGLLFFLISFFCLISIFKSEFTCFLFKCGQDVILQSVLFGFFSFFTLYCFFKNTQSKKLFLFIIIFNLLFYFLLPNYTDYFLPAKEDGIIYLNLSIPFLYIILAWIFNRKNRK